MNYGRLNPAKGGMHAIPFKLDSTTKIKRLRSPPQKNKIKIPYRKILS